MDYINHFGEKSEHYRQFRPEYPDKLYQYLNNIVSEHELVWDCGTGNGQAAVKLADYFSKVIASDSNQSQLDVAIEKENIQYHCFPAEKTLIPDHSVDLITVAQALHWFNLDAFYLEVNRVAKKNGILAAWCYSLGKINSDIDILIIKLYSEILGDRYWPKERYYIDAHYQTIPFPYLKMDAPVFKIEKSMNFFQLIGYLNTWSAVKEYYKINQENPINLIYPDLQKIWGKPEIANTMYWPIYLLVGKVHSN